MGRLIVNEQTIQNKIYTVCRLQVTQEAYENMGYKNGTSCDNRRKWFVFSRMEIESLGIEGRLE